MTGRVEQGIVKVGEEVEVVGLRTVCKSGSEFRLCRSDKWFKFGSRSF